MKKHITLETIMNFMALLGIAGVFSLLVILGWRYKFAPQPVNKITHAQLVEQQASAAARAEWLRLRKKHGYPGTVIYPEGEPPYYMCGKDKKQKCKFI
jgi:hypothetical protein